MKQLLLIRLLFLIITVLYLTSFARTEHLDRLKSFDNKFDTLKVLKELALSREDSVLLHIEELKKEDYCDCENLVIRDSIFNNLHYLFHIYISVYSNPNEFTRYGSARIIYKKDSLNTSIYKLSIDSLEIFQGSLSGIVLNQEIIDINYDGYKDLHLSFTENTTGRTGNNIFFLFSPVENKFVLASKLNNQFGLEDLYIDPSSKLISTGGRTGPMGFDGSDYIWNGNEYIEKFEHESFTPSDTTFIFKKELRNGEGEIIETDTISN